MRPASLVGLAVVTAVAVIAAAISVYSMRASDTQAERGTALVPDLVEQANAISAVTARDGESKMEIVKDGERYVDAATGYPVRTDAVRDLVSSLAVLDIEERKTARPERYGELDLAEAGSEEGAGRHLTIKAADNTIAELVLGKRDYTVGGARGGLFARHADRPPAYLVRGDVSLPATRAGWFDAQLIKLGVQEFKTVTMTAVAGDPIELVKSRSSGALMLNNMPAGETADPSKVQRYGQLVSNLSFEDVRKGSGAASGKAILTAATEKVRISITPVAAQLEPDDAWVQVSVKPQAVSSTAVANTMNEKVAGYEFKLKQSDAEPLAWQLADVLTKKGQPSGQSQPAIPGMPPGLIPGLPSN